MTIHMPAVIVMPDSHRQKRRHLRARPWRLVRASICGESLSSQCRSTFLRRRHILSQSSCIGVTLLGLFIYSGMFIDFTRTLSADIGIVHLSYNPELSPTEITFSISNFVKCQFSHHSLPSFIPHGLSSLAYSAANGSISKCLPSMCALRR